MSKKPQVKEATKAQEAQKTQAAKDAATASAMQDTVAGDIWKEIKDRTIEMFALPGQIVSMHCHPVPIEPSKLYLMPNSTAVLPSLEAAVGKGYTVESADRFIVVARATPSLTSFAKR